MAQFLSMEFLERVRQNALVSMIVQSHLALRQIKRMDPEQAALHARQSVHSANELKRASEMIEVIRSASVETNTEPVCRCVGMLKA